MIDFSSTALPLVPFLPDVSRSLDRARALALSAEPGAGKSTLVPPFLMDEPWLAGRAILMLEPRRLAAVAVASRIADLLGEPIGRRAGYRVRTASRVSRDTRIEVMTEALLTRRIQDDPLLQGVGLVIVDEFHERSIHADLALALAMEVRRARPELALLAMSATLDTQAVALLLGAGPGSPAPAMHCPGTAHPVTVSYRPFRSGQDRWDEELADSLAELFDETDGNILTFLPGVAEIRRVGARLAGALGTRADVLPLHGTLRLEEQSRVILPPSPGSRRRVVLATSIAETSLTVPGVSVVADSGWARFSRFHPATGLDRLVTEKVSAASATQRRGRAGRLGPGVCVRFWPESEHLLERMDPEILRSDLAGLVLECAIWGARRPEDLSWMDPPPQSTWSQAWEMLAMLRLVDASGPTPLGKTVAALGLSPRLGLLVVRGGEAGTPALAAACAAVLQERDGSGVSGDPDFRLRLEALRLRTGGSGAWRASVEVEIGRILRRIRPAGPDGARDWTAEQESGVGALLAGAFPDRLARREPDGSYRLVTGRMGGFSSGRGVVPTRAAAQWIVALDADPRETTAVIRLAAPVDAVTAEEVLAGSAEESLEIRWEGLVPRGSLVRRAGRLVLTERNARPAPSDVLESFRRLLAQKGLAILPWSAASTKLLDRLRFYGRARPGTTGGDLTEQDLVARSREWLEDFLKPTGGQIVTAGALHSALSALAGAHAPRLAQEVPESIVLPTGGKRAIDYSGTEPAVEARIQELFGLSASPLICGVPLTFRLLSPAHRPLQVTRDLGSFWRVTYAEVRKEMRGRYPRHYWPEDPFAAQPTSRVRPEK